MRREGHIIEEIVEYSNIAESFDQVISGTKRKKAVKGVTYLRIVRSSLRNFLSVLFPASFM